MTWPGTGGSGPAGNAVPHLGSHSFRFRDRDEGQLVLSGGVAMAFAILLLAGLSQLGTEMDANRDIEPSLGPEFSHLRVQFEDAVVYRYNTTGESATDSFLNCSDMFSDMEFQYGLILDFTILNITGTSGDETIEYRMELVSTEQYLAREGTIELTR